MKHRSRWFVMILSLVLLMLSGTALASYSETDSYVLYYGNTEGKKIIEYASPYTTNLSYEYANENPYSEFPGVISLYNTYDADRCLGVYCVDEYTSVRTGGHYYSRINLEDSTYFSNETAAKLRSIMLKGFPQTSYQNLGNACGAVDLTLGEAVHATQLAIWQTSYGDVFQINKHLEATTNFWQYNSYPSVIRYYDEYLTEYKAAVALNDTSAAESRIKAAYNYLMGLSGTAPSSIAVSNSSFTSWSSAPNLAKNEDGSYNITVEATVNVQMSGSDALTLSAVLGSGDYYASAALSNGTNSKTLTIQNVPAELANADIKLAIDGTQTASDIFLFIPRGERDSAQSMIGYESSQLPVHAEVVVGQERVITLRKLNAANHDQPLEGILFDFYFKAELDDYLSGETVLPADAANCSYSGYGDYSIVTDSNGRGTFSLTKNNMKDGVYLVVERPHPAITAPVKPFYVIVPATNPDGTGYVYNITVSPKNAVKNQIDIEKDVIELGNDLGNVSAYEDHTWIISASIPDDIANGKRYVISDTLDSRLDFIGNVVVQVESADGSVVRETLTPNADYALNVTDNDSLAEGAPRDSFTVSLTAAGMAHVGNAVEAASDVIRVYFDAQINSNAQMSDLIPNQADIQYRNSVGVDFSDQSDIPEVYTGSIQVVKYDAADENKLLPGAVFEVYREVTTETTDDDGNTVTTTENVPVLFFDHWPTDEKSEKVSTITTGENGTAFIYGLEDGVYYLKEIQAPAGYNLLTEPVEVTLQALKETTNETTGDVQMEPQDSIVRVENRAGAVLPETGGMGTTLLYVGGGLLVLLAFVCLSAKRKAC